MNRYRALALAVLAILLGLVWIGRNTSRRPSIMEGPYYVNFLWRWLPGIPVWPIDDSLYYNAGLQPNNDRPPEEVVNLWNNRDGKIPDRVFYALLTLKLDYDVTRSAQHDEYEWDKYHQQTVAWLKRGQQLDADNGLYNLLLTYVYLEAALKYREFEDSNPIPNGLVSSWELDSAYIVIRDEKMLQEALQQYRIACTKTVRTYQQMARPCALRDTPILYEQFVTYKNINDTIIHASYPSHTQAYYAAVRLLMKRGDTKTAHDLLDIPAYLKMFNLSDHDAYFYSDRITKSLIGNTAVMYAMAKSRHDDKQAQHYRQIYNRLAGTLNIYKYPLNDTKSLVDNQAVQTGFNMVLQALMCSLALCIVSMACWTVRAKIKRRSYIKIAEDPGITNFTAVITAAYVVFAFILMGVHMLPGWYPQFDWLAEWLLYGPPVFGWFWMRRKFKTTCREQGMTVPGRMNEILLNWVPVLVVIVLMMVGVTVYTPRSQGCGIVLIPPFGWAVIAVMAVAVAMVKMRTSDYYVASNLAVRHYLTCLVMWVTLGLMPLLLTHEMLMVRHFAMNMKSAQYVQQQIGGKTPEKQLMLEVKRILDRIGQ